MKGPGTKVPHRELSRLGTKKGGMKVPVTFVASAFIQLLIP